MESKKISSDNITTVGELIEVLKTMPANATICGSKFNDHDEYDCEVRPFSVGRYFHDMDDNEGVVYVGIDYKHPN